MIKSLQVLWFHFEMKSNFAKNVLSLLCEYSIVNCKVLQISVHDTVVLASWFWEQNVLLRPLLVLHNSECVIYVACRCMVYILCSNSVKFWNSIYIHVENLKKNNIINKLLNCYCYHFPPPFLLTVTHTGIQISVSPP